MSDFTMSAYRGHDQDAPAVLAFLTEISQHPRFLAEFHIGDFIWQGFRDDPPSLLDHMALWRDAAGKLVAFGWLDGANELAITIHPALTGTKDQANLFARILAWGEERSVALRDETTGPLGVIALAEEPEMLALLDQHGFRFSGETCYAYHTQTLEGPLPAPELPGGYEIVEMTDGADLTERVEIHRDVWAPSKFTLEGYLRHRAAPVYRQDLDLVVRAPDGRYASYLIAWFDPISRTGLFEPVGARSEYRRLGLTRALIYETLRRLRALGATRSYVGSIAEEGPAMALYRATGFTTIGHWQWWTRS